MAVRGLDIPVTATRTGSLGGVYGAQVRGTLRSDTGTPLSSKKVEVKGARGCGTVLVRVETPPDGSYRAENLPAATFTIAATPGPGYANATGTVTASAMGVHTRNLVAQQLGRWGIMDAIVSTWTDMFAYVPGGFTYTCL